MAARRVVAVIVLTVLLPLGWLLAAPQQLGGPIAVVTTYGNSMLPTYTASDLVVVAEAGDYDVGDVVAYRSEQLGAVVLHRIVDVDDDGYVTSGDNNDWLDPDRPTHEDIMGTARLRIPGAGRLIEVPVPVRAAMVTALTALALFGGSRRGTSRSRRRRDATAEAVPLRRGATSDAVPLRHNGRETTLFTAESEPTTAAGNGDERALADDASHVDADAASNDATDDVAASEATSAGPVWIGWPAATAMVAATLIVAGAVLAGIAFSSSSTAPGELEYTHQGTFDYTTPAQGSLVYPDGEVTTGEPVFLRLVDTLDIAYTHEFDGPMRDVHMIGRLWLELSDGSGWTHRTPLGDEEQTTDAALVLDERLDVPTVRRLIEDIREQTGVSGGSGSIDVIAEVEVTATLAGEEIVDEVAPTLGFELGEGRLMPRVEDDAQADAAEEGTVTVEDLETARLEVAGRGLEVPQARALALVLLVLGLLALAVAVAGAVRRSGIDESERVRLRYASKLVEVTSLQPPANHGIAMVRDISALAELADLAERPILHHQAGNVHTYVVEDAPTQYRYTIEVANGDASDPTHRGDTDADLDAPAPIHADEPDAYPHTSSQPSSPPSTSTSTMATSESADPVPPQRTHPSASAETRLFGDHAWAAGHEEDRSATDDIPGSRVMQRPRPEPRRSRGLFGPRRARR